MTNEASGRKDTCRALKMHKRVETMKDGRILIYYRFDDTSEQLSTDSEEKIERTQCPK